VFTFSGLFACQRQGEGMPVPDQVARLSLVWAGSVSMGNLGVSAGNRI